MNSLWKTADLALTELEDPESRHAWVEWNGQQWLRKCKHITMSEIIGYQLAGQLGLPLLEYLAFSREVADR